jgi:O-antigen/teichoic acid export membrane protein
MLKRYFVSNILIMLVLNILVKPIWVFFIDRNVQLTVGHHEYGVYSALVSLTIIFNILLDMGITNLNNKNLASDTSQISLSLPNMMVAKGFLSIIYFTILFSIALLLNYNSRALYLLLLLAGVQFLNSFLQYLRSYVSAHQDFRTDSILSVIDKILMIAICGILLYSTQFKSLFVIEWFIYTQLICYVIAILLALMIVLTRYSKMNFNHFSFTQMIYICKQSIPYALLILLMGVYMRSDSLMLERLEGPELNSYYASTYRILDIVNMSGFLFASILLPMFSRLISKQLDVKEIVHTSCNILLPIAFSVVAFSFFYSQEIMKLLYPDYYTHLTDLYKITIACFPAFSIMYIFATLLTANGNIQLLIKIALGGSITSLILNFLLIKWLHASGAALASLIVEWCLAITFIYFARQKLSLSFHSSWILKFFLHFGIMLVLNFLLQSIGLSLIPSIIINFIMFVILVYGIKLWDRTTLSAYINQFKSAR